MPRVDLMGMIRLVGVVLIPVLLVACEPETELARYLALEK